MPCESCAIQFSVFRRRRACPECERSYCAACLRRGGGSMCAPCRTLSTKPLTRQTVGHLKVRDIQCFLQRQNVSTRGCVEKDELVNLCINHVNSPAYRRRPLRSGSSTFSTLKGFTNNINEFINNTFDLRNGSSRTAPPEDSFRGSCYNNTHAHNPSSPDGGQFNGGYSNVDRPYPTQTQSCTSNDLLRTRIEDNPNIERPIPPAAEVPPSQTSSCEERIDTDDCFEIEDLGDGGWEVIARPADPLPQDSDILLREEPIDREYVTRPTSLMVDPESVTPQRSASVLELRSPAEVPDAADTNSLKDEPCIRTVIGPNDNVQLSDLHAEQELEQLTVRQLKLLLTTNRVEYRGCVERGELLQRALTLYRDHLHYREQIDNLPIEECCKICMAAPLECVLLECGHMATCTQCGKQLAECPICRQYVVRAVRFFRS